MQARSGRPGSRVSSISRCGARYASRHSASMSAREALVTRRIGIDDIEAAFEDMTAGQGARSVVCFGTAHETST